MTLRTDRRITTRKSMLDWVASQNGTRSNRANRADLKREINRMERQNGKREIRETIW